MKLDGFGIFVEDLAAMISFYREVLGFEIKESAEDKNVFLEKDGTLFLMYGRRDFEKMTGASFGYADGINGHFELALSVENFSAVDREFDRAVAMGARPVMRPATEPWGQRTCYIADPEGNLIEIGSFTQG